MEKKVVRRLVPRSVLQGYPEVDRYTELAPLVLRANAPVVVVEEGEEYRVVLKASVEKVSP